MANSIKHKRSSIAGVVPTSGSLSEGELGINMVDGYLYYKDHLNQVKQLKVRASDVVVNDPGSNFSSQFLLMGA
jgi:hypothetical protein